MKKFAFLLLFLFCSSAYSQNEPLVFGNKFQKVYYVGNCGEQYAIPQSLFVYFKDEKEAIDKGFKKAEKCTLLEVKPTVKPKDVFLMGDTQSKIYYQLFCTELRSVPVDKQIGFSDKEEAEKAGYKLSTKCTPPKPTKVVPLKPINLLEIDAYPQTFFNKIVTVRGHIIDADGDAYDCFGVDSSASFVLYMLTDNSSFHAKRRFYILVNSAEARELFKRKIVDQDGASLSGTFTLTFRRVSFRANCAYGVLATYNLDD